MEEAYTRLEESNRRIQTQYDALSRKYEDLSRKVRPDGSQAGRATSDPTTRPASSEASLELEFQEPPERESREGLGAEGMGGRTAPNQPAPFAGAASRPASGTSGGTGSSDGSGTGGGDSARAPATAGAGVSRRQAAGIGAQGTDGRVFPPETAQRGEEKIPRRTAKVEFAEGLELSSPDEEFKLTFHNLTQAEYRAFPTSQEGILKSQWFVPRQRWYFTGRVTRNVEFYTVINRGYGSLDILDAFLTYRIDERFRLRFGRMKTPYLYEYFSIAEGDLTAPERSIYAGNLAANRQIGAMALGELFDGRLGYALGMFNGPRRSFEDNNGAKDVVGYVNSRPFLKSQRYKALQYLNIGGSFDAGYETNTIQPVALRTANDETTSIAADSLSPTFLTFNNNVVEHGQRTQWAGHLAWFYNSFMLLAEYAGGVAGYTRGHSSFNTYLPYDGYFVQSSYFVTGEHLTRRVNIVKPRKDFSWKKGERGPGAIELHARYSALNFSPNVFTSGFADPNLWTNDVWATDVGLNWYLNFYTKVYLDWQHSEFGSPVVIAPNRFGPTRDLFWFRFQVFF